MLSYIFVSSIIRDCLCVIVRVSASQNFLLLFNIFDALNLFIVLFIITLESGLKSKKTVK